MTRTMTIYVAIFMTVIMFLPKQSKAQNLEVVGKAKITVMDQSSTAENVVVQLPDGTLGVRQVSSLSGSTGNYGTVVNPVTGKVWLDRNLGATQVATSSTDAASYGDIYQWGRGAEGHQVRTSGTTTTQATDWLAGSGYWQGLFITTSTSPYNWLSTGESQMWSGTAAENNPCPSGFRIPTNAEWNQERLTWITNNAAGAFASPLKLPVAGFRILNNGSLGGVGSDGYYWSSTVSNPYSRYLFFSSFSAYMEIGNRAAGGSVRCVRD